MIFGCLRSSWQTLKGRDEWRVTTGTMERAVEGCEEGCEGNGDEWLVARVDVALPTYHCL